MHEVINLNFDRELSLIFLSSLAVIAEIKFCSIEYLEINFPKYL